MAEITLKSAEIRIPPQVENIDGRHVSASGGFRRLVPVKASTTQDAYGRTVLAAAGTGAPVKGLSGLADFVKLGQAGFENFRELFDRETIPASVPCLRLQGSEMKVAYRNSTAVKMVAGTLAMGAYVTPVGTPNDTNGYLTVTATAADAWGVITDLSDGEIEIRFTNL